MPLGENLSFLNPQFISKENRFRRIDITDIPILVTDRGEIVCIPKSEETFAMAIVGGSGTGKSLVLNRLATSLRFGWDVNVSIMNDVSEETYLWSMPMTHLEFNEFNKFHLNQEPSPAPIFYLYPNTNTVSLPRMAIKARNRLRITIPFAEIIDNLNFYLKGVIHDFDLAKSELYINDIKEELATCQTPSEIKDVLNEKLPGKDGKSFAGMRIKLMAAFNSLFKEEILDITNPQYPSKLRLVEDNLVTDPFSVLMGAGQIPSLITSDLQNKNYKSEMMAYYVDSIFRNNLKNFGGKKTFLLFDELRAICERDDDVAARSIGSVAARGRINQVGLVYCTQYYDKIPNAVKGARLNYCVCFRHSNSEVVGELARDFSIGKKTKEAIMNLKLFEAIIMTNQKLVVYDMDDGSKSFEDKPFKGKIFFPVANHRKP
jgi:hypothetical protein